MSRHFQSSILKLWNDIDEIYRTTWRFRNQKNNRLTSTPFQCHGWHHRKRGIIKSVCDLHNVFLPNYFDLTSGFIAFEFTGHSDPYNVKLSRLDSITRYAMCDHQGVVDGITTPSLRKNKSKYQRRICKKLISNCKATLRIITLRIIVIDSSSSIDVYIFEEIRDG